MKTGHVELARAQQELWQTAYERDPHLHGTEPSAAARSAAEVFGAAGIDDVLELGAGQGRDALYLARQGFSVHATDFSDSALHQLRLDAQREGLDDRVTAALHDVRDPLPPRDATVNAVFANLLLNMAFSRAELWSLVAEIHRVLRPAASSCTPSGRQTTLVPTTGRSSRTAWLCTTASPAASSTSP